MKKPSLKGLSLIAYAMYLVSFFSCQQKEENIKPKQDASLEKHIQFLEKSTGESRDKIVFDSKKETFFIDEDMFISKEAVEGYLAKGESSLSSPNKRTEQRRGTYLAQDHFIRHLRYFVTGSVPAEWRAPITQAIAAWNNVGGTKMRMLEVGSAATADITVDALYDGAGNWVARAQLPYSDGQPGRVLTINTRYNTMEGGQKLFAMAHEMGHNIGFLHTNLTDGSIIPGTPTTDANSVMNSSVLPWNGFTHYDKVAVRNLYPVENVRFDSHNFPGNFIRHQNGRARISTGVSPFADSQFRLVAGLAGTGVSFQSVNFPGSYLRHRNGEVWLDASNGTALFNSDATFHVRPGLADPTKMSFESVNFPGNFLRHRGGLLFSEGVPNAVDRSDATFAKVL